MENKGPRRSERIAKRTDAGNESSAPPTTSTSSKISVTSTKTTSSVTVRQKQVEVQVNQQIAQLEEELDEFQSNIELAEHAVKEILDELDMEKDKLFSTTNEDIITGIKAQISIKEREIKQKMCEVEKMQIEFRLKKKKLERKKKLLLEEADLQKEIIAEDLEGEENSSQDLSDDDDFRDLSKFCLDVQDKTEAVSKWSKQASGAKSETEVQIDQTIQQTLARLNENQQRVAAEEAKLNIQADRVAKEKKSAEADADLLRRFENLKASISSTEPTAKQMEIPVITLPPPPPQQNSNEKMDAFMSRQTMKQDLPYFDGNVEEWPIYISQYRLVTSACGLRDEENLMRLQKSLKGKARECVRALLMSSSNVSKIIEVLERRFGEPTFILESLIQQVKKIPSIAEGNLEDFLSFVDAVRNLSTTATAMKCEPYLTNPTLIRDLINRLPWSLQSSWAEFLGKENKRFPDIMDLTSFLERKSMGLERIYMPTMGKQVEAKKPPEQGKREQHFRGGRKEHGNRVLVMDDAENSKKFKEKKCVFCNGNKHTVSECQKFTRLDSDDRWKWIKEKNGCFGCMNKGHSLEKCYTKKACGKDGCQKYHHPLLHSTTKPKEKAVQKDEEKQPPSEIMAHAMEIDNEVSLLILPVKLYGPKGVISTVAMLDCGATLTVIEDKIAMDLGLEGKAKPLSYSGLHPAIHENDSHVVELIISNLREDKKFLLTHVRTTRNMPLPRRSVRKKLLQKWSHLKGLRIDTYENAQPKILIGMDHPDLVIPMERRIGPGNAPGAALTELGWILYNRNKPNREENISCFMRQDNELEELNQMVKHHFSTEALGVKVIEEKPRSKEDKRGQEIMDVTLKRMGDRFEIGLLWKEDDVQLPENRQAAFNRLLQQERKMDRDADFAHKYVAKIDEYVQKGFASKVDISKEKPKSGKRNYLSHFMAYNPKKPNKLRFVFDAAAKVNGRSLNDALLVGPDQLNCLPHVLYKFRQKKYGITADIRDMFHRVKVIEEDVEAQRFLWRGLARDREPDEMQMNVLIFGATCSPTCAQEVKNKNAEEFQVEFPLAAEKIKKNFYVDDLLSSEDTVDECVQRFLEIEKINRKGGFHLCNVIASKEVLRGIPEHLRAQGVKNLDLNPDGDVVMERVLGLFWKPEEDIFTYTLTFLKAKEDILNGTKMPTKRELLALVMSIYDPLGFMSIFTIKAKMLLQECWRTKVGWDDEIPKGIEDKFKLWIEELQNIPTFILPRCYGEDFSSAESIQLHVFCDASEEAFGAVAYFRIVKDGRIKVALVTGKARVASLKSYSMPRMELQAALVGSRLAKFIEDGHEVKMTKRVFWSDNQTVLCWLRSDSKRYQTFVAHRVGEIQELTDVIEWRYVPTKLNVADELTRDKEACKWGAESRWINGPAFLQLNEDEWPKEKVKVTEDDQNEEVHQEIKRKFIGVLTENQKLIEVNKFSSWRKFIRTVAYMFRIRDYCLKPKKMRSFMKELSPDDIKRAEIWCWRQYQRESFPAEMEALLTGKELPKNTRLQKLNVKLDEKGVMRLYGRIEKAVAVSVSMKNPVLLDPKHHYTKLVIMEHHVNGGHHGRERVVNELRQQYHILNMRNAVKRAWMDCQTCKNNKAQPIMPEMGQLPAFRLESHNFPFNKTGLDYFGPMEVTVGRRHEKRYGALFTCLSTRAVHVEIAASLTTDSCINAIRRFVARRGCPSDIYSDNGTNFVGANHEMKKALKELHQEKLEVECCNKGIRWHFNPPLAPHMGGSWERLVKSIKTALYSTLKEIYPKEEVLQTLMAEAEHIVNSHPLTYVPVDPDDPVALTPNHFLIGRTSNVQSPGVFQESDLCLRKQWRKSQRMADNFWKRWVSEYLPTLLNRKKWHQKCVPIKVGDIVLEISAALPRNAWPMGRVVKVYPGDDGQVRVVDYVNAKGHTFKRSVKNLCVLDVRAEERMDSEEKTAK